MQALLTSRHSESKFLSEGDSTRVEISELQPGQECEWDRFVIASPSGTQFHLCGWKSVIEAVLKRRSFWFVARRERQIVGVFPLSLVKSRAFGHCLVSLPLTIYGGICARDEESYVALLNAGTTLAHRLGVRYLEMRNRTEPFSTGLPGRDLYVTFSQDLSPGPEKLLSALPRDTRYMIRKVLKSDLRWVEDLSLAEFYEIYARSVHHLGTPVFSKQLFARLRSEFGKQCRLFGVRKGTKAIAGVLCFYFRDEVIPYYGGSLPEFNRDSPNNFMYWNLIVRSYKEGCGQFDFGRSKKGTGSFSFKSSWSMKMTELPYRYALVRAKGVPQMSPVDQKFRLPVSLWKRLPFACTKILGPRLIRLIPSV